MRERMVTRTVKVNTVKAMCVDTLTAQVEIREFNLTGDYEKTDTLKLCKKRYETETFIIVKIESEVQTEVLYGMPETDFIKIAKVLPNR